MRRAFLIGQKEENMKSSRKEEEVKRTDEEEKAMRVAGEENDDEYTHTRRENALSRCPRKSWSGKTVGAIAREE